MKQNNNIKELAYIFLKLGFTAFGGPAAHIAMMREEFVVKRDWLTEQQFLDLMGATNLIPGPNSTELAIHIGKEKGGWKGMFIAGGLFIFPAFLFSGFFAYLYKQYGQLPQIEPFIYGIKPAIIAIILSAVYPLGKKSLKSKELGIIGAFVLGLSFFIQNEILLMFGAGILFLVYHSFKNKNRGTLNSFALFAIAPFPLATTTVVTNGSLFWIFLKIGAILYGSGYVLFAFLDAELVTTGILSRQQLIDAIAVGQITPGPVTSSVTFIGYQINGFWGAVVSTFAVFLPSFVFVALLNPLLKFVRNSNLFSHFLDAVNIASVALIVSVCFIMGRDVITDWKTIFIAVTSLVITFGYKKVNSVAIILIGSLLGYVLTIL